MKHTLQDQSYFKCAVLGILLSINSQPLFAQALIHGKIVDKAGDLVIGANVFLLNAKDSILVKGALTDNGGGFLFEKIGIGQYLIEATHSETKSIYTQSFEIKNAESFDVGLLKLEEINTVLSNVTVTARKPLYEQKIDRLVINVASSVTSAGSTALDVLERSPGVTVSRFSNSISINGKAGVLIMINGKRNYMDMPGLVQWLSGMPSSDIERIEIITTPPANFDAEGDAGIINIVLKTNNQFGNNGSYSLTGGYNKGAYFYPGLNWNHRKGKINLFGNYSFSRNRMEQVWTSYHAVTNNGVFLEDYSETARHPLAWQHNGQAGIDYEASKKTIVGLLFTGGYRNWDMKADNSSINFLNSVPDTVVSILNHELHTTSSFGINANFQHSPKAGEKISVNFDYLHYYDNNPNDYSNDYFDPSKNFLSAEKVKSGKKTPLHFWIGTIDYEKKLSEKLTIETGLKQTLSHLTNDVVIATLLQNNWVEDTSLSGFRKLDESISAAYSSATIAFTKKTSLKFGLRYELASSVLGTANDDNIVNRHYSNLFPSCFFLHTINEQNSLNLSYSRRISRPSFADLAPWVIFYDPKTFQTGNPALLPSIADAINLTYTYKNKIVTVSYSYETNPINNQPALDETLNRLINTFTNGKTFQSYSINFSLPFKVSKWWIMQNNIWGNRIKLNDFYKEAIEQKFFNFYLTSTQTFLLPKNLSLELNGWYSSKRGWGLYTFKPIGSVNFGVQQKFEKKKSSLSFNIRNIFNSLGSSQYINKPEQNLVVRNHQTFSYIDFSITFNRRFGKDTVKEKRERLTGAEDERGRAY